MRQPTRPWADLAAIGLLTWMGIHTIRTYLSMAGWVLGSGLTVFQLGVLLLAIWGTGLLGYPMARLVGGRSPAYRLGLLFGLLYVLYRAMPGPYTSPLFGCLSVIAWLWVMPAALREIGLRGAGRVILPGVLLGVAGQVALQTGLHGLDMVQLLGPGPGALALALAAGLAAALRLGSAAPAAAPAGAVGWSFVAWGPFLALQMTLAANLGWIQWFSGWQLQGAAAFVLGGLALGATLASLPLPRLARVLAGLAAVALLAQPQWLHGPGIWLLFGVQALLPVALAPALAPEPAHAKDRTYLWVGTGSVAGLVLILLFYLKVEGKFLWPLMAAAAVLPGLLQGAWKRPEEGASKRPDDASPRSWQTAAAVLALGAVAIPLSLVPRSGERPPAHPAPAELTVMTYNIHHLFSWRGVPNPEAIARVIEEAEADLIGLQETNRGWNFTGGADLVSWLRWRFPGYHVRYGKTEGDLVGNILLSRYPVLQSDWTLFEMVSSPLQRGYIWVRIPTEQGDLLFLNTHLSAFRNEEPDRISQMEQLLAFWNQGQRPRFILLGDLNARPGSEPLRRLEEGGLTDLPGALGLGQTPTFPAGRPRIRLDYVFGSAEIEPLQAHIPESLASDHRPVVVRVRLR